MNKIYTRTGDEGSTNRPSGERVRKSDPAVSAVGAIDELGAHIGLCVASAGEQQDSDVGEALQPLQGELLTAAALLAAAGANKPPSVKLAEAAVGRMEGRIDTISAKLPELTHFILPRGCELACRLHVARTVCRRAERAAVAAADAGTTIPPIVLRYLNRLSDLLFVLARLANHNAGMDEVAWQA